LILGGGFGGLLPPSQAARSMPRRREASMLSRLFFDSRPDLSDRGRAMKSDIRSILNLDVPLIVRIAERVMHVDEVVQWVPGMIIEMAKSADEELELLVNNVPIGVGSAVKITENFGIRITFVGDLRKRIGAISGGGEVAAALEAPGERLASAPDPAPAATPASSR